MSVMNPYLNFNGNAEEAFNFYKSVFGGEFSSISRFKDVPPEHKLPDNESEKIMHVALPLGKGTILMGSDVPGSMKKARFGDNIFISIMTESEEEASNLFNKLSNGGNVLMPMNKTFWGDYFGMASDKFGVQWMISYHYNQ